MRMSSGSDRYICNDSSAQNMISQNNSSQLLGELTIMSRKRALALNSLGKESYASQYAITNLVAHIRKHGAPETYSRASQYRASKKCITVTQYGTTCQQVSLPTSKGGEISVTTQAPLPFLAYTCDQSESYARIVGSALRASPCSPSSPWHIIVHRDRIDLSDMGATHHTRSACAWYWSIAAFGMYALGHEEVWGCVCTLRKSEYNRISVSICGRFTKSLVNLFRGTHDIKVAGVTVYIRKAAAGIFADV